VAAATGHLPAVANTVGGQASTPIGAVADAGRLATITSDSPATERGIRMSSCFVVPDGGALSQMAARSVARSLSIPVASTGELSEAAGALAAVASGKTNGGIVLTLPH
jgi:Zinc-binding dehydrogenase